MQSQPPLDLYCNTLLAKCEVYCEVGILKLKRTLIYGTGIVFQRVMFVSSIMLLAESEEAAPRAYM
jgi:hypothetical protein